MKKFNVLLTLGFAFLGLAAGPSSAQAFEVTPQNLQTLDQFLRRNGAGVVISGSYVTPDGAYRAGYTTLTVVFNTRCRVERLRSDSDSQSFSWYFHPAADRAFDRRAFVPLGIAIAGSRIHAFVPIYTPVAVATSVVDNPLGERTWFTHLNPGQRAGILRTAELVHDVLFEQILAGEEDAARATLEQIENLCNENGELN